MWTRCFWHTAVDKLSGKLFWSIVSRRVLAYFDKNGPSKMSLGSMFSYTLRHVPLLALPPALLEDSGGFMSGLVAVFVSDFGVLNSFVGMVFVLVGGLFVAEGMLLYNPGGLHSGLVMMFLPEGFVDTCFG